MAPYPQAETPVRIHCFFGDCDHTVEATDPDAGHDEMEAHYSADHPEQIMRLIG